MAAFNIYLQLFLRINVAEVQLQILNRVLMVYAAHSDNYWLLYQLHPMVHFLESIPKVDQDVQSLITKVLFLLID